MFFSPNFPARGRPAIDEPVGEGAKAGFTLGSAISSARSFPVRVILAAF